MNEPLITFLSKEGTAQACDVSLPTVTKWLSDIKLRQSQEPDWSGCPVHSWGGNGKSFKIDLEKLNIWRQEIKDAAAEEEARQQAEITRVQSTLDLEGGSVDGEAALSLEIRKKGAETVLAEHKASLQRGELIQAHAAQTEMERIFKMLATRLQALPDYLQRTAGLSVEGHALAQEAIDKWQEDLAREFMSELNDPTHQSEPERIGETETCH